MDFAKWAFLSLRNWRGQKERRRTEIQLTALDYVDTIMGIPTNSLNC